MNGMSWKNWLSDYLGSNDYFFLDDTLKEHAELALDLWLNLFYHFDPHFVENQNRIHFRDMLFKEWTPRLEVIYLKQNAALLLAEFCDFLAKTPHAPAIKWAEWARELHPHLQKKIRSDGSLRGETQRNKGEKIDRNDPCLCGSGKKFKKCCGPLFQ